MKILSAKVMASLSLAGMLVAPLAGSAATKAIHDEFYWLDRLNRVSLVMMSEQEILDNTQTATIAKALDSLRDKSQEPNFKRTSKWSTIEPYLVDIAGPVVTRLHTGRSTRDTGAVNESMQQREKILGVYESLIETRQALLDFGKKHATAIIPAYTGGMQAQPTSMAIS